MAPADSITPSPGTYVLRLEMDRERIMEIGALGYLKFPAATYLYVGSAHGPGGLRARLRHHRSRPNRPHWHLDYLRRHAQVSGAWLFAGPDKLECQWAEALSATDELEPFGPGFGSSGCGCSSHLLRVTRSAGDLIKLISERIHPVLFRPFV